jgi:hypothetical protein
MWRLMDSKSDELDVNFAENLVIDAVGGYRVQDLTTTELGLSNVKTLRLN